MQQFGDFVARLMAMRLVDVVDITIVASLIYAVLYAIRGTRAVQLLRGILLLVMVVAVISQAAQLRALTWVGETLGPAIIIAIPVIFQPELRRALERLGRASLMLNRGIDVRATDSIVTVVSLAARRLSEVRYGALIVIERETGLHDLTEQALPLDAVATVDLLLQIFHPKTPLHDGAVIIREGRIVAARVVLPLSEAPDDHRGLGTRHLAAIAASEVSDAVVVVVSEETGTISLARDGELVRHLDEGELSRLLYRLLAVPPSPTERLLGPIIRSAAGGPRQAADGDVERVLSEGEGRERA